MINDPNEPRRFRIAIPNGQKHPNGTDTKWRYGVYFPQTDLVVGDMGGRGTGKPSDVEWLDDEPIFGTVAPETQAGDQTLSGGAPG